MSTACLRWACCLDVVGACGIPQAGEQWQALERLYRAEWALRGYRRAP